MNIIGNFVLFAKKSKVPQFVISIKFQIQRNTFKFKLFTATSKEGDWEVEIQALSTRAVFTDQCHVVTSMFVYNQPTRFARI